MRALLWLCVSPLPLCGLLAIGAVACGGRVVVARELGLEADAGVSGSQVDAGKPPRHPIGPGRTRVRKPPDFHDLDDDDNHR